MSQKVANIGKNTSYFTLALILQKVISFTYFTIYARELGPADLGKYYFALSFTTIVSFAVDLGIVNYFTKELARERDNAKSVLAAALGAKILLVIPTLLFIVGKTELSHYDLLIRQLIYVAAASMIMDAFTSLFFAVSRAHHNLKFESITAVISQATTLVMSLWVLSANLGLVWLMWAQVASSLVSLLIAAWVVSFKWKLSLKPSFKYSAIKTIFALSFSFGLYVIFQRFYTYIDSVLLFHFAGDKAVGLYQVPFKITNALQFLPMAFVASLYPALSSYWKDNREQLGVTFERAINYSVILAMPISVGLISLAEPIVALMKSGYEGAIWPMRLTAAATFFMFVNYPVGALLNACDRQRLNTRNMAITALAAALFNLILIPFYGVMGAVWASVASNFLMFALNWSESNALVAHKSKKMQKVFWQALGSSLIMAVIIWLAKPYVSVLLLVPVGALIYFVMLFTLGAFTKHDIESIAKSFKLKR